MRFSVHHETLYRYSVPVAFAPHVVRLSPRPDAASVVERVLRIEPEPVVREERIDPFGNLVTEVSFGGPAAALRIESTLEVDTFPWDLHARAREAWLPPLPWRGAVDASLVPYREPSGVAASVRAFSDALRASTGGAPYAFAARLGEELFARTDRGVRVEGPAQPPEVTLERRSGACRDLAVLFIAACRAQGIPARFVSGYQARAQTPRGQRFLHAWAEIHLEGVGWCGWDPMHGIPVGDGHLALAAAPDQASTMPVEGGFYANGVTATLDWSLRIATG